MTPKPKKKVRRDMPEQVDLQVKPSEWLKWYGQHLAQVLQEYAKTRTCEREDLELVLLDRSDLQRATEGNPDAFGEAEKKRLAELDERLKTLAPAVEEVMPDIKELRRQLEIPRSHWWWYLEGKGKQTGGKS